MHTCLGSTYLGFFGPHWSGWFCLQFWEVLSHYCFKYIFCFCSPGIFILWLLFGCVLWVPLAFLHSFFFFSFCSSEFQMLCLKVTDSSEWLNVLSNLFIKFVSSVTVFSPLGFFYWWFAISLNFFYVLFFLFNYLFLCSCSLLNFKIILNSLTVLRSSFLYGQLLELYYFSLVSCLLFMILDSLCWSLNIWASNLLFLYCRFILIETVPHRHCSSGFQ